MIKYGYPLIFTGILLWFNNVFDRFFLLHYSNLAEIRYYSIANIFSQPILIINMAISMSSVVFLCHYSQRKMIMITKTKKFFKETLNIYISLAVLISLFISIFSYELVFYITTPEYLPSIVGIPFLVFSLLINQISQITGSGMSLMENTKPYMWITFIAAISNISMNFYFIPQYGFLGASITTIVSNFIYLLIVSHWSLKYFDVKWSSTRIFLFCFIGFVISFVFPFFKFELDMIFSFLLS